jgi:penicillin-insensitive murein DD-endopeptidase
MRPWVLLAVLAVGCSPGTDPSRSPAPDGTPQTARAELAATVRADATEPAREPGQPHPVAPTAGAAPHAGEPSQGTAQPHLAELDPLTLPGSRSTSIGSCTTGRLEGGVALPLHASGLLPHPAKDPGSRFGTVELVQGLVRAAAAVERASPGAPLTVGDLAREGGGEIPGHGTHRSGRDVDVLFYLRRADGEPFVPAKAIPLDPAGRGTDFGDLADPTDDVPVRLDVERTWAFVAALLADEASAVQKILIVEHLRSRLLEEAKRVEAPAAVVQRFADVTCQPRFPHDDHMHIRVFCSLEDIAAGCVDGPPSYPWRTRELTAAGVEPAPASRDDEDAAVPKPTRGPRPKLKTIAQARAEAGPMHEDVVEFLDRRDAWAKRPHPGRRWCQ